MAESLIMVFMVVSILIGRKGEFDGDGFVFEKVFLGLSLSVCWIRLDQM